MSSELRAYLALTRANLRMYIRNPVASFSLFAVLLFMLVALKVAFDGPGPHTRVAVSNASSSSYATALLKSLQSAGNFEVIAVPAGRARPLVEQGKADMAISIPAQFGSRDGSGHLLAVRLDVTYAPGTAGESSLPVLRGIVEGFNETVLGQVPIVSMTASALHARPSSTLDFLLPGLVTFNIIGSALMLAAGIFSNYKATGVLRRLKATGIRPSVFVLSHATASFILGMLQTAAMLVVAALLYTIHLDLPSLFLLLMLGYLVFFALGLAISGWIKDPQRANGVTQGVAMPMILIGLLGSVLPVGISQVTRFLPVSYLNDGIHLLGQGAGLPGVAIDLAWLLAWAVVLLAAAGRVFRWD